MKYTFDLMAFNIRKETTTSYEEACQWFSKGVGLGHNGHSVNIQNNMRLNEPHFTVHTLADLEDWKLGNDEAEARSFQWSDHIVPGTGGPGIPNPVPPTTLSGERSKINLKTAVGNTKARFRAVPPIAYVALGMAMQDGAEKYDYVNWRDTDAEVAVFAEAMMRHLIDYLSGENFAKDSKVHHLAHIMAGCAILLDAELYGVLIDNRPQTNGKLIEDMKKILRALEQ